MTLRVPLPLLREGPADAPAALVHYVCTVHRTPVGTAFVVFDPQAALEADATLEEAGERLVLHVGPTRPAAVRALRELVIVQGFAKGDKCDAIVRDATELGATRVVVVTMARSIARPAEGKLAARRERWERIASEAARQANRGDAPRVEIAADLDAALASLSSGTRGFVLWERATAPLAPELLLALATPDPIALVVGPEGGLEEAEVESASARGMFVASLGPFVLRTETVAAAVLGAVRVLDPRPTR